MGAEGEWGEEDKHGKALCFMVFDKTLSVFHYPRSGCGKPD